MHFFRCTLYFTLVINAFIAESCNNKTDSNQNLDKTSDTIPVRNIMKAGNRFDNHQPFTILSASDQLEQTSTDDDKAKCSDWTLSGEDLESIIGRSESIDGTTWDLSFSVLACVVAGNLEQNGNQYHFKVNAGSFVTITGGDTTFIYGDYVKSHRT